MKKSLCEHCKNEFSHHELFETGDGNFVCRGCLLLYYTMCFECGNYFLDENVYTDNRITICQSCKDSYYTCDECGDFVHYCNIYQFNDGTYCEYCFDQLTRYVINEYDFKPNPVFYGEGEKYFGIELEIDGGGEDGEKAKIITDCLNEHVYCKHDGSLDEGFEIVTHPMSYEYIKKIKKNFKIMMETALDEGYVSHNAETCGLHIHVSKKFFGECEEQQDLHIAKILYLIEKHWGKMVKFSRRTEEQIEDWAKRYCEEVESLNSTNILQKAKNSGRYHTINLKNKHTIEFRLFRGTLKFNTFIATIQFVHHLTDLAKKLTLSEVQGLTWRQIVNINKNEYPELIQYLRERKLV